MVPSLERQLLANGKRLDGRKWSEHRPLHEITFLSGSLVQVCQSQTQVTCKITAEICTPPTDQPNQGLLSLAVHHEPQTQQAQPQPQPQTSTLTSILEYLFKESKCLDLESLCIQPAVQVWHIRAEVRVLQLEWPNFLAVECASVALLAGLLRFRRPEPGAKAASVPLGLKQNALAVQVAWETAQGALLADPTASEAEELNTAVLFAVNGQREMNGCWKAGGQGVSADAFLAMANSAVARGLLVIEAVKESVKADLSKASSSSK
jgi:exosome complex component RRP45